MIETNTIISNLRHHLLVATERLNDTPFSHAVIYICQHDAREGSMGVRINQPVEDVSFSDLIHNMGIEDMLQANFARQPLLLNGGPVDTNKGIVLHSPDYRLKTSVDVGDGVTLSATQSIVQDIARGMGPQHVNFCLGYSGWSVGQLEQEIAENDWLVLPAESRILFKTDFSERYNVCIKQLGLTALNFNLTESTPIGMA